MSPSESVALILTILTPTWNRRHLLPRLYESLLAQNVPTGSFEWLVVDDGSADGTAEWLQGLISEAPFPIRVVRQENGGKPRALNYGATEARSPWVMVLDSDDWLLPGGLANALTEIKEAEAIPGTQAIFSPHRFEKKTRVRYDVKRGGIRFSEWFTMRPWTDVCQIFHIEALRSHPYPEFSGEKYIAPTAFHARAFQYGGIRLTNAEITCAEYQPDGISAKSLLLRSSSSLGAIYTYSRHIESGISGIYLHKAKINLARFYLHAIFSGKKPGSVTSSVFLYFPAASIVFLSDKLQLFRRRHRPTSAGNMRSR